MRFVIHDGAGAPIDIHDMGAGARGGWVIAKDGVSGWHGTPAPRNAAVEASGHDGDFFPIDLTSGARTVTIQGYIKERSNVAFARALDRLNSLVGKHIKLECHDFNGVRTAEGFVSDDPAPTVSKLHNFAEFTLVVTCPDPLRYGRWASYAGQKVRVPNNGNADSYPKVIANGYEQKVTNLALACDGQQVRWSGSADSVEIDFATMVPSSGTVTLDNAFAIPPGGAVVTMQSDGYAVLMARDAWR